jgi:8-oxo-dGTP pyrophosphatase MutT (NUDIX family)
VKIYVNNIPIFTDALTDTFSNGNVLEWVKNIEESQISAPVFTKLSFDKVIDILLSDSKLIEAAGGMVFNPNNEFLLIYRRGSWDLPKGKIDLGETPQQAGIREVWEECGLQNLHIDSTLPNTYHTYWMKGKRILKKTYWFKMTIPDFQEAILQTEEDIEDSKWIKQADFSPFKPLSYPSIVDVIESV